MKNTPSPICILSLPQSFSSSSKDLIFLLPSFVILASPLLVSHSCVHAIPDSNYFNDLICHRNVVNTINLPNSFSVLINFNLSHFQTSALLLNLLVQIQLSISKLHLPRLTFNTRHRISPRPYVSLHANFANGAQSLKITVTMSFCDVQIYKLVQDWCLILLVLTSLYPKLIAGADGLVEEVNKVKRPTDVIPNRLVPRFDFWLLS